MANPDASPAVESKAAPDAGDLAGKTRRSDVSPDEQNVLLEGQDNVQAIEGSVGNGMAPLLKPKLPLDALEDADRALRSPTAPCEEPRVLDTPSATVADAPAVVAAVPEPSSDVLPTPSVDEPLVEPTSQSDAAQPDSPCSAADLPAAAAAAAAAAPALASAPDAIPPQQAESPLAPPAPEPAIVCSVAEEAVPPSPAPAESDESVAAVSSSSPPLLPAAALPEPAAASPAAAAPLSPPGRPALADALPELIVMDDDDDSDTGSTTRSTRRTPEAQATSVQLNDNFDPYTVPMETLHAVAIGYFNTAGLEDCEIEPANLDAFLTAVESRYSADCCYHNYSHAFNVLQLAVRLLRMLVPEFRLPAEERLAFLICALCHDLEHPGVPNSVVHETDHRWRSSLFGGEGSVNEKHSISLTMNLLSPGAPTDILSSLSKSQRKRVYRLVHEVVIATDIFGSLMPTVTKEWKQFLVALSPDREAGGQGLALSDLCKSPRWRMIALRHMILLADIGVVSDPFAHFIKWAKRLFMEQTGVEAFRRAQLGGAYRENEALVKSAYTPRSFLDVQIKFLGSHPKQLLEDLILSGLLAGAAVCQPYDHVGLVPPGGEPLDPVALERKVYYEQCEKRAVRVAPMWKRASEPGLLRLHPYPKPESPLSDEDASSASGVISTDSNVISDGGVAVAAVAEAMRGSGASSKKGRPLAAGASENADSPASVSETSSRASSLSTATATTPVASKAPRMSWRGSEVLHPGGAGMVATRSPRASVWEMVKAFEGQQGPDQGSDGDSQKQRRPALANMSPTAARLLGGASHGFGGLVESRVCTLTGMLRRLEFNLAAVKTISSPTASVLLRVTDE